MKLLWSTFLETLIAFFLVGSVLTISFLIVVYIDPLIGYFAGVFLMVWLIAYSLKHDRD